MNHSLTLQNQFPRIPFTDFPLTLGTFLVGRSRKCDFVVKDNSVSRRHAEIKIIDDGMMLQDLASRNGTYVNNRLIRTCTLQNGHHVRFGGVSFLLTDVRGDSTELNSDLGTGTCQKARTVTSEAATLLVSKAQRRILDLLFSGLAEKQIAAGLNLSKHTVHNHITAIYQILGVHSRAELLARFLAQTGGQGTMQQ